MIAGGGLVSIQVINEYVNVSRKRLHIDWRTITQRVNMLSRALTIVPNTFETSQKALSLAARYQLHIYDANIWAAAILAKCETLYSEDMHAGLSIEGTTLVDPFAG